MAENLSQTVARKVQKHDTVKAITDHIIEQYKPQDVPIVLMWKETMNGFNLKLNEKSPVWNRDDRGVHEHWKRYGSGVVKALQERKLTVVKVNRNIRDLVKHGTEPKRSGKRTDERYCLCLPSPSNMTLGIVVFPRGAHQDHPLIVASRDHRAKAAANGVINAVDSVRAANDLGNLSEGKRDEITVTTRSTIDKKFNEVKYPLFDMPAAAPPLELPSPDGHLTPEQAIARLADGERIWTVMEMIYSGLFVKISRSRQEIIDMINRPGSIIRFPDTFAVDCDFTVIDASDRECRHYISREINPTDCLPLN